MATTTTTEDGADLCAHCQTQLDFFMASGTCIQCQRRFCRACKSQPDVYVVDGQAPDEDLCTHCFNHLQCSAPECHTLINMADDAECRRCNTCNRPFCGACVAAGHAQLIKPGVSDLEYGFWWCGVCYTQWQQQAPAVLDAILDQQPSPEPIKEVQWPEDLCMDSDGTAASAAAAPAVSIDLWYQIN